MDQFRRDWAPDWGRAGSERKPPAGRAKRGGFHQRARSLALAGTPPPEFQEVGGDPGVPLRMDGRSRTKNLVKDGPECVRVRARSPADTEDVRGVTIAGLPD